MRNAYNLTSDQVHVRFTAVLFAKGLSEFVLKGFFDSGKATFRRRFTSKIAQVANPIEIRSRKYIMRKLLKLGILS